jgi:dihydrofolate reductase
METVVRTEPASVHTSVCVHDRVEMVLSFGYEGGDSAKILMGGGEEVLLEFIDAESLDRLAAIATEAAVGLRERIEASRKEI